MGIRLHAFPHDDKIRRKTGYRTAEIEYFIHIYYSGVSLESRTSWRPVKDFEIKLKGSVLTLDCRVIVSKITRTKKEIGFNLFERRGHDRNITYSKTGLRITV